MLRADVHECNIDTDGCDEACTNTIGGYTCSCPSAGYELASDSHTCVGKWVWGKGWGSGLFVARGGGGSPDDVVPISPDVTSHFFLFLTLI